MRDMTFADPRYSPISTALELDPAPPGPVGETAPILSAGTGEALAVGNSGWQPKWLRQSVLGSFAGLFLCLAVLLAAMTAYSRNHDGLFDSNDGLVYLWRFGPVAFLTVISILWSRVELQALRYMQWMVFGAGQNLASQGYNLDYSQMLLPMAFLRSIKFKHRLATLVIAMSIITKAGMILSAGLFRLTPVTVRNPHSLHLVDSFQTEDVGEVLPFFLAYYSARAIQDFDMAPPFGVSQGFAYQTFEERGTVESPIEVEVDGFFVNMTCQRMEAFTQTLLTNETHPNQFKIQVDLEFEDCNEPITVTIGPIGDRGDVKFTKSVFSEVRPDLEPQRPSSSLPQQHPQFLYFGASVIPPPGAPNLTIETPPEMDACAAVLCSVGSWLSKVKVLDDGRSPNATVLPDRDTIEVSSDLWRLSAMSVPPNLGGGFFANPAWLQPASLMVTLDAPVGADLHFRGEIFDGNTDSFYQVNAMEQAVKNIAEGIGPIVGHNILRQQETTQITGWRSQAIDRLQVNEAAGVSLTVVFGLSGSIVLWMIFESKQVSRFLDRDPATILGSMVFALGDCRFQTTLSESLARRRELYKTQWSTGAYSPMVLRWWLRVMAILYIMSIIAALVSTLEKSRASDGLVTISGPDSRFFLLWTSLPALCVLVVAQYVTMSDSAVRDRATLSLLYRRECTVKEIDLSLLNMLGFRALYYSVRLRVPAIAASQLLVIATAFLTALSAILFTPQLIYETKSTMLQQRSWFGSRPPVPSWPSDEYYSLKANRTKLNSLIPYRGVSNLTYPPNTYAGLVFPNLEIDNVDWDQGVSVRARLTAAKLIPVCVKMSKSEYELFLNGSLYLVQNYTSENEAEAPSARAAPLILDYYLSDDPTGSFIFGAAFESFNNPRQAGVPGQFSPHVSWREMTYAWGTYANHDVSYISTWQCNYTWTEVMTATTLVQGGRNEPVIDHSDPPVENLEEVRPWEPPFPVPPLYDSDWMVRVYPWLLVADPRATALDDEFRAIMEPYGSLIPNQLEKAEFENDILEALHSDFALLEGQIANMENRLGVDEGSDSTPTEHGELAPIDATITLNSRYRLIQNSTPTFVMIWILSLVVLINLWALISSLLRHVLGGERLWLIDLGLVGVAPDGFSNITVMEALLDGSNVGTVLPDNAHLLYKDELYQKLESTRFRIGWFGKANKIFTIGEVRDEGFQILDEKGITKRKSSNLV